MAQQGGSPSAVVFGCDGMFGRMALHILARKGRVLAVGRSGDVGYRVEDGDEPLCAILRAAPGALIVNAICIRADDIATDDPASLATALLVNGVFPHRLAVLAAETGGRLVHISTDAVFGRLAGAVTVGDPSKPDDDYGLGKLAGEVRAKNAITVRCSIIGPAKGRGGLWDWLAGQPPKATVHGFTDQHWSGCTTLQLAELCAALLDTQVFDSLRRSHYLHHYAPNRPLTKHEALTLLRNALRPDVTIEASESGKPIDRRLIPGKEVVGLAPATGDWTKILADCRDTD